MLMVPPVPPHFRQIARQQTSSAMTTPSIFRLRQRMIPGSGGGSGTCRRLLLLLVKTISQDVSQFNCRLFFCPVLNNEEFYVTRGIIGGWYNQIRVIGIFT